MFVYSPFRKIKFLANLGLDSLTKFHQSFIDQNTSFSLMNKQIGMLAVVATVLLTAAFLATPTMKAANAQANQTKGLDVDKWIVVLKQNHPTLADIQQAQDVKDAITKIKDLKDAKEAVRDLLALHILNDLMDLKTLQEAQ